MSRGEAFPDAFAVMVDGASDERAELRQTRVGMPRPDYLAGAAFLPVLMLLALAAPPAAQAEAPMPGNYCVSCHAASDPALSRLDQWRARPPEEATCPGVKAYREQLLYTEQLLTAAGRAQRAAGGGAGAAQAGARLAALAQEFEQLRQTPGDEP